MASPLAIFSQELPLALSAYVASYSPGGERTPAKVGWDDSRSLCDVSDPLSIAAEYRAGRSPVARDRSWQPSEILSRPCAWL